MSIEVLRKERDVRTFMSIFIVRFCDRHKSLRIRMAADERVFNESFCFGAVQSKMVHPLVASSSPVLPEEDDVEEAGEEPNVTI